MIQCHTALPLGSKVLQDGKTYRVVENNKVVQVTLEEVENKDSETNS